MTAFTDSIIVVARNLLTEFGESVTFSRAVEGAYDTSDGTTGTDTDTNYTGFAVKLDTMNQEDTGLHTKQQNSTIFVEKTSVVPLIGDEVLISTTTYRVMDVERFSVSGVDVLYKLQLRV